MFRDHLNKKSPCLWPKQGLVYHANFGIFTVFDNEMGKGTIFQIPVDFELQINITRTR